MKIEDLDKNKKYVNGRYTILDVKGNLIVSTDISNLSTENYSLFFLELTKWLSSLEMQPNSVLNLVNAKGNKLNKEILEFLKDIVINFSKPYTKKTAVYGIPSMQKVFVDAINKLVNINIKVFKTKEEAIEWLIKKHD